MDLDVEALLEESLKEQTKATNQNGATQATKMETDQQDEREDTTSVAAETEESDKSKSPKEHKSSSHHRSEKKRSRSRERSRRSKSPKRRKSRERSPRRKSSSSHHRDKDRDRDRDREREKDRDREKRDKREKERDKEKDKDKKEEVDEAERDERTVFASNLPIRATETELEAFFSKAGKVRDIRLITDKFSRKSKGFGYIEYANKLSVPAALHLSGMQFKGQVIMVQATQAEKNRAASTTTRSTDPNVVTPSRLYVGSLHPNITEDDIRSLFEPFGPIESIDLHTDPVTKKSLGFALVTFHEPEHAKKALAHTNSLPVAGLQLKVGLITDNRATAAIGADLDEDAGMSLGPQARAQLMAKLLNRGDAGALGTTTTTTTTSTMPLATGLSPPSIAPTGVLPIGIPGVLPVSGVTLPVAAAAPDNPLLNPLISPVPTNCVLLKNMFDPATETEPDYDVEIAEDVGEECSKHGRVLHIKVIKESHGYVYMKMDNVEAGKKVQAALNHRWFAGRMISAEFLTEATYNNLHNLK